MADLEKAKRAYATIIAMMNEDNLKYQREDEKLRIKISFSTNDLDVDMIFSVDADRSLVRMISFLPDECTFSSNDIVKGAVAVCVANHNMVNGSFDYDINEGDIFFKLVDSYRAGDITVETVRYMLSTALHTIDQYNDRFRDLANGTMSLNDFIAAEG